MVTKVKGVRTAGSFGRRVRGVPVETTRRRGRRWPTVCGVIGILLVALFVRFYGLSHDLSEGNVYHPDTPKQIDAARAFLDGHYYFYAPHSYAYFTMHIVEWEWRGLVGIRSAIAHLMGWQRELAAPGEDPDLRIKLFVVARVSICVMSAGLVLVVYAIGREAWGTTVGLVAAGLLALSPVNVELAHYAMGDTAMDFFAGLTVLFAMRMYRTRRVVYPVLAAFFGALAFSAKYNGGIVLVFVLVLHVLRFASPRRLFGAEGLRNGGLLVAAGLAGFCLGTPSFLIYPDRVVKEIGHVFRYLADYGLTAEQAGLGWWARVQLFAGENAGMLLRCVGPIVMVAAVAGFVVSAIRRRRTVLVGLFPILYLVVSLVGKPVLQPYWLSVLLPYFCLYAAVVVGWLGGLRKLRVVGITVGSIVVGAAVISYAVGVVRSDFFFWHMDTRRMATAWVRENVPDVFHVRALGYTLCQPQASRGETVETVAIATGSVRRTRLPANTFLLKEFKLEERAPLTVFRNSTVTISGVEESAHLEPGFSMPVYQRISSATGNEFVFPAGAEFVRSERLLTLRSRATRRIFVIPERPEEVMIGMRNGDVGNVVMLSFGEQVRTVVLRPLETGVLTIQGPTRMALIGRPFYKFWARAPYGCRAEVAVSDEQKGVLYFNAAMYKEALPYLAAAWKETKSPTIAQMAVIAARCAGTDLDEVKGTKGLEDAVRADLAQGETSLVKRFGVSAFYLDELPYVALEAEAMSRDVTGLYTRHDAAASGDTCLVPGPTDENEWSVQSGEFFLEPGAYKVTLSARVEGELSSPATVRVSFVDATGQITCDEAVVALDELVGPVYREVGCTLRLGEHRGRVALRIAADPTLPLRIDTVEITPDFEAAIEARDALVRALLDGDFADLKAVPEDFDALLAYAEQAEGRNDFASALAACEKAIEADPGSYRPYELLRRMRDRLPEAQKAEWLPKLDEVRAAHGRPDEKKVAVRFKNGAELTGYRISADEYAPGDTVELTMYWQTAPAAASQFAGRWLFIHFVREGGPRDEQSFQGDTDIVQDFGFDERLDRIRPLYRHRIRVPDEVEPGTYEIEVGILIGVHDKRIRVIEADVPRTNNSATIGSIRIVKRAPDPSS